MPELKRSVHAKKTSPEAQAILRGILKYNGRFAGKEDWQALTISFKDKRGKVVGGLTGHTDWGWLFVKLLWVSEKYRHAGLGTQLMLAAEEEARKRNCKHIWLDTFTFQAPKFYQKLGYREFGRLKDYPKGYNRYFLTKKLR